MSVGGWVGRSVDQKNVKIFKNVQRMSKLSKCQKMSESVKKTSKNVKRYQKNVTLSKWSLRSRTMPRRKGQSGEEEE